MTVRQVNGVLTKSIQVFDYCCQLMANPISGGGFLNIILKIIFLVVVISVGETEHRS